MKQSLAIIITFSLSVFHRLAVVVPIKHAISRVTHSAVLSISNNSPDWKEGLDTPTLLVAAGSLLSCTAKPHISLSHSLGCVVQAMPSLLSSPRPYGTKSPAALQLLKRPRRMTGILHGLDADAIIEPSQASHTTRQSIHGRAKAIYDQKYHPMDDYIRRDPKRRKVEVFQESISKSETAERKPNSSDSDNHSMLYPTPRAERHCKRIASTQSRLLYSTKIHPQDKVLRMAGVSRYGLRSKKHGLKSKNVEDPTSPNLERRDNEQDGNAAAAADDDDYGIVHSEDMEDDRFSHNIRTVPNETTSTQFSPTNHAMISIKVPTSASRIEIEYQKDDGEGSRCSTTSSQPLYFPISSAPSCGQTKLLFLSREMTDEEDTNAGNGEATNVNNEESQQNDMPKLHFEENDGTEFDK
jgi:hypothetical protein